jgi:hypothetical protein
MSGPKKPCLPGPASLHPRVLKLPKLVPAVAFSGLDNNEHPLVGQSLYPAASPLVELPGHQVVGKGEIAPMHQVFCHQ